jgi:hypothetical protein
MAKSYKDMSPKEKYDSAIEADKAEWSPGTEIRKLVREKLGMDNENMAKGVQLKLGPTNKDKPTDLNPKVMKKGGSVGCGCKKMEGGGFVAKANGCAIRGKTKGRIV